MICIVKVYKYKDCKRILKGFDGKRPVFITQGTWNRTKEAVQEFTNTSDAMKAIDKIKATEPWRHYEIVRLI